MADPQFLAKFLCVASDIVCRCWVAKKSLDNYLQRCSIVGVIYPMGWSNRLQGREQLAIENFTRKWIGPQNLQSPWHNILGMDLLA